MNITPLKRLLIKTNELYEIDSFNRKIISLNKLQDLISTLIKEEKELIINVHQKGQQCAGLNITQYEAIDYFNKTFNV